MSRIDPSTASAHRSATVDDPADPEIIDGRRVCGAAIFSPCRTWRWRLERHWDGGTGLCLFLMLNPSTADAHRVDPTVRRAATFAMRWGYAGLLVGNVYALRATKPTHLGVHPDPVGPDNDLHLATMIAAADRIVAAWGVHIGDGRPDRDAAVRRLLAAAGDRVVHLGMTKDGHPGHPLYLRADTVPVAFHREPAA